MKLNKLAKKAVVGMLAFSVAFSSIAPTTYLFELTDRLKIIQVSWMIFFFTQKTSSNILKRKDGA